MSETDRIIITHHIRVYECGADGWAIWDDYTEECPLYPTPEEAIAAAKELAGEYERGERS